MFYANSVLYRLVIQLNLSIKKLYFISLFLKSRWIYHEEKFYTVCSSFVLFQKSYTAITWFQLYSIAFSY